jgi:hypothetical protein
MFTIMIIISPEILCVQARLQVNWGPTPKMGPLMARICHKQNNYNRKRRKKKRVLALKTDHQKFQLIRVPTSFL